MIEVVAIGAMASVQDLGRPGYAHLGVPHSGALDRPALTLANRLVGNAEGDAGIELTYGGAALRVYRPIWCAVTGAGAPLTVDGRPVPFAAPFAVAAGRVLRIGRPRWGVRSYLAVSGGIATAAVLGSRSADTLSGLGGGWLSRGERLPVGAVAGPPAPVDCAVGPSQAGEIRLRVRFGPRDGWFTTPDRLLSTEYAVGAANRVGMRLLGPPLARSVGAELPSEGLVEGAIQVPADGRPLIFLADHPTTGGYPVIAVVHPMDLPRIAQARPGELIRFVTA